MMSSFINSFDLEEKELNTLKCFVSYVKQISEEKFDNKFWHENSPSDLIDVSNELVRELPEHKEDFPFERKTLVDLIFILFKWMYQNKWTDHKLVRRTR